MCSPGALNDPRSPCVEPCMAPTTTPKSQHSTPAKAPNGASSEAKSPEPRNLHEAPAFEPEVSSAPQNPVPEPDEPQEKAPTSRRTNKKTEEATRLVSFAIPVKLLMKTKLVCGAEGVSMSAKVVQLLEEETRIKIKKVVAELTFLDD